MRVFALLAALVPVSACGGGGDACEEFDVDLACTPQYAPTFDNIFANTLTPKCNLPGTACHSIDGARAGLIFETADQSFDLLTGSGNDVLANDVCGSELSFRILSDASNVQMPPGNPLSAGEQCAILQWIDQGAQR